MKTEVCLYSRHVTQELTLWLVGSIGDSADLLADVQPDDSHNVTLPTPLLTPNEIELEVTNGAGSPEPQPPSPSESPLPSLPGREEPVTLPRSRRTHPGRSRLPPPAPPIPRQSDVLPIITRGPGFFPMNSLRAAQIPSIHQPSPLSASRPHTSLQTHPRSLPQGYLFPLPPPPVPPVPYVRSLASPFSVVPQTCAPGRLNPITVSRPGPHGDKALPLWIGM